jgi:hypothetical protein
MKAERLIPLDQTMRAIAANRHTAMPTPPTRQTATAHKRQRVFICHTKKEGRNAA